MRIQQLGKALSILAQHEVDELIQHDDVDAWGAPSECHRDVSRGEGRRWRRARKHAEAVARAPLRVIEKQAKRRGGFNPSIADPRWQRIVSRLYVEQSPFI